MKCKECTFYYCQYRTTDAEKDCYYEIQYTAKDFDWEAFRAEAAKDILAGILSVPETMTGNYDYVSRHVSRAIMYADELIKQLKEKEEKWKQVN